MDHSADALTDSDEVRMDVQKGYGYKYTYGTLSISNYPISIVASKSLSSNMDSRSFLPTKTTSFT